MQAEDPQLRKPGGPITPYLSVIYPKLLPASAYDLSSDPTHKYTQPDLPSVRPPGYEHENQLACEVPAHLWPHNAEKLGMVRFFPRPGGVITSRKVFVYQNETGDIISVYHGFLYTHPGITCSSCKELDIPCVQYSWDGPGPDNAWPNRHTGSITAQTCLTCVVQARTCTNTGCHILQPTRQRLSIDPELVGKLQRERFNNRQDLMTDGPPKTCRWDNLKPTASKSSQLGKRQRLDPTVSASTARLFGDRASGFPTSEGTSKRVLRSQRSTQTPPTVPPITPCDTLFLSLEQVQHSIQKALKERRTSLQDAQGEREEIGVAKQRVADAERRMREMEGWMQEVTEELTEMKGSLMDAEIECERVATTNKTLAESNQKLVASERALAATRSEIREELKATDHLHKEIERLKAEVQKAVISAEDAQKATCRRIIALEADLETSKLAAHELEMQSQTDKEPSQIEKEHSRTEKADLERRLLAAERRVKELEW